MKRRKNTSFIEVSEVYLQQISVITSASRGFCDEKLRFEQIVDVSILGLELHIGLSKATGDWKVY